MVDAQKSPLDGLNARNCVVRQIVLGQADGGTCNRLVV